MRFEIVALGQLSALGRLELLHGAPVPPSVLGGERLDRVDEAVAVVALDLVLGQLLSHGRYPTPTRRSTSSVRRDLDSKRSLSWGSGWASRQRSVITSWNLAKSCSLGGLVPLGVEAEARAGPRCRGGTSPCQSPGPLAAGAAAGSSGPRALGCPFGCRVSAGTRCRECTATSAGAAARQPADSRS